MELTTFRWRECCHEIADASQLAMILQIGGYEMCKHCALSLTLLFVCISFAKADLTDGLVLYMPFDEGQGDVANDFSENSFTGDLMGDPEWVNGEFGKALSFDGDGDYVEIAFDDAFDIKTGITMAAWVTGNIPFSPEWRVIINARKSDQGPWGLQTRAAATLETYYDVAGVRVWTSSTSSIEPDVFHHVAGTYSDADGFSVYFDGVLEAGANSGNIGTRGELNSPPAEGIVIGYCYNTQVDRWWDGTIDEVVVYNRALSAEEMAQLFEERPTSVAVSSSGKLATVWGRVKRGR